MNKLWCRALFIICLLKTMSVHAYDAPIIFSCLEGPDYECLNREIGRDQEWYKQKNTKNKTPLRVALDKKNVSLVSFLLDKGAQAKNSDVIYAMKVFYKIPKENLLKNVYEKPATPSLSRQLLLGAQNTKNKKFDNMALIGQTLSLFCEREEIALEVAELFNEKKLSNTEVQRLLYEFKDIFLHDKPLTHEQMQIVVSAWLPLPTPHLLLRFIINMSKRSQITLARALSCKGRNLDTKVVMAEELAQAIIENSRTRLLKIPPPALLRHITQKNGDSEVNAAIDSANTLSNFVLLSIKLCTEDDEIQRRYLFWFAVYEILILEGDFMGAFAIASSLNSPETQRKLRSKIYKEIKLVDPEKNYKNYRDALVKFKNKFHIPAPQVHLHDLTMTSNFSLISHVEDHDEIDEGLLNFYVLFNKEMGEAYLEAFKRKYPPKDYVAELFKNLPLILMEPHPDNIKLEEAITFIWPKPAVRRRSGTFF